MCYPHIEFFRYEVADLTVHAANSKVFMAFCDVTRLKIIDLLREGEKCATVLREKVDAGQSTLSHHMKSLVESGVVIARKEGKWTFYSISESGARYAAKLLKYLTSGSPAAVFNKISLNAIHTDKMQLTEGHAVTRLPIDKSEEKRRNEPVKPFTIVVDTSSDLTPEFIKENDIKIMPIPFVLNGIDHNEGYWQNISAKEFYDALRNGGIAGTSQINPDTFVKDFEAYAKRDEDALYIILSSGLSATYQSSQIALADIKEAYPDCNIFPIDSIAATCVSTLLIKLAVEKRNEGFSAAQTAAWLEEKKNYIHGVFTVDDLMYLHRGGRLSKLSAVGGSLLGIKPVLNINPDGTLGLKEKIRGRDAALKLLVTIMERSIAPGKTVEKLIITHTDCAEDALKLEKMVREKYDIKELETILMGPVIGAHVGPGTAALIYEADMKRQEFEDKYYK